MTFTKEQLIEKLKHRISVASEFPESEKAQMDLDLARIALASLEAEPVAYIFKHPAGKLFWALTDESNKDQSDVIPVYAAPPVPVVPAALPENDDEDGHDIDYLEPSEVYSLGRTAGWNACRDAMLHGAEPVSQTYKLNELSGNSPVTPDGWISCSERMPDDGQHVIILCDGAFVLYAQYRDGEFFDIVRNGDEFFETQSRNVTDWMPLPEPPQEAK